MLNLDTHVLVFFLAGSASEHEHALIEGQDVAISDIVLWELAMLEKVGRLSIALDGPEFREFLRERTIICITLAIARKSTQLDFSSDPADEIIAATSVVENIPLLTRDRRILKSRMVPFAP